VSSGFSVTTFNASAGASLNRNYDLWDAYLGEKGFLLYSGEGGERQTEVIPLQPPQTDTRIDENEMPSALGRRFTQTDWSHGMGQLRFHRGDSAKYLYSEGFDVSEIGLLKHLIATATAAGGALTAGSSGKSAVVGGRLFVIDGTNLRSYDLITGAVVTENPHAGEAAVAVQDITSEGDRLIVALGVNGIHIRSAAGVYSHYSDAAALLVEFLKDRIIAATARLLYEITAGGAAPTPKTTLKEGWTFTSLAETGTRIYASAINETAGLSKVFFYGLDNSLNVIEEGSSWFPGGDLCYSILGHLGQMFMLGGRVNSSGGKDTLFYRAEPAEDGSLPLQLVMDSEGAGTRDLAGRAMLTWGRKVLLGWTLGAAAPYGVREGIALYDPALDSFYNHLSSSITTTTPDPVLSIQSFEGRIVFVTIDGVYYQDLTRYVSQAFLITSTATFGHAGLKNWDLSEVTHKELPSTASVEFQFSRIEPDAGEWEIAGTNAIPDSTEDTFRHPTVDTPEFTLKIISNASSAQASAPEIKSFSVRATPTLEEPEYRLVRTIRIFDTDRGASNMQAIIQNPREKRDWLRTQINQRLDYYEADTPQGFSVRLVGMTEISPIPPVTDLDTDAWQDAYLIRLTMEGTVNSV
jgi:hypothetical protein